MASSTTVELQSISRSPATSTTTPNEAGIATAVTERPAEAVVPPLAPADSGRQAYMILLGCTFIQAPIWGLSLSFGVFQEYYTTTPTSPYISASPGAIATVGTTLNGIMYLMMPLSFTFLTRYPKLRPYCGPTGLVISVCSFVMSSFATQVWQLVASQGVLCAIGSGLLFSPTTLYLDEWFIRKKGLAYGTIWAGKSLAGCVLPYIMSSLLSRFGHRTTLQAWAVTLVVLAAPPLLILKPRVPVSANTSHRPLDWRFVKLSTFWMLQTGNIIQSLGYLMPSTYIASYAHDLGLPNLTGAILISAFSVAAVPGSIITGVLNDRFAPTTVILISSFGSSLAVFLFWGLSSSIALLATFIVVYGFFAGGFSSTYPGVLHELRKENRDVDTGLVMGMLLGGRGVGFVIGGPISSVLLKRPWSQVGNWGYNTRYGPVIVATGITALFGGWGWMWKILRGVVAS